MPSINVVVESPAPTSGRARQLEGMFDVPPAKTQSVEWHGDIDLSEDWSVGLIVGPSGCGKSTCARELFPTQLARVNNWGADCVIDDFDKSLSVRDIADVCMAVGFNTIPAWLRPHRVLSNGEQFRVDLARRLIEADDIVVVDEFTSVVDRQVAQIGSHAVQKYVRSHGKKFVGVSCHYDVVDWLNPDWIFEPATMNFQRRLLRRRPQVDVEVAKVRHDAWELFAPYHYMTNELHGAAQCYCLFINSRPAAFAGILYRPHPKVTNVWGVSRLVTLPDFQGLGLAFVLSDLLGSAFRALGQRLRFYPAHPALMRAFDKSNNYRLEKSPALINNSSAGKLSGKGGFAFGGRPNATFEYVGPSDPNIDQARSLLSIKSMAESLS